MADKQQSYSYQVSAGTVTSNTPVPVDQQPISSSDVAVSMNAAVQPQTVQPGDVTWMPPPPASVEGVPQGLEYLTQIDQLLVHQQLQPLELMTGVEMQNKYQVKNSIGQQVYFAVEESGYCTRQCCGPSRGFVMHINDNYSREVIRVTRDFKCCAGCCWCACSGCCAQEVTVEAPVGQVVGRVKQKCSFCVPKFSVYSGLGEVVFDITGPLCRSQCMCCPRDIDFTVTTSPGGTTIGKISKQWSGFTREAFSDADNFAVRFPMDLDVRLKAILLGAVFLIDFLYFEHTKKKQKMHGQKRH